MKQFTKKQLEEIRSSVESFMDFKIREVIEDFGDGNTDEMIFGNTEGISEKKFFECVESGDYGKVPEEEINTLVKSLTNSYMNLFK